MRTMIEMNRLALLGLVLILDATVPAALAQQSTSASYPVYQVTNAPEPIAASPASGTTPAPPPSAPAQRSAAELQKLAEPIALYPDPLISIVLPAAAYPLEVVKAARFVKDTNNIPKVDDQPWDENVKSVAKIPQVVSMMDSNLTWTVDLGEAFVEQPKELMDAIQALRALAQKAGTLQTTPQQVVTVTNIVVIQTNVTQVVTVTNKIVEIYPANPQVVYVPVYPPTVYYPPPAYVYNPYAPLVTFGVGIAVGAIIANNCNWHSGGVYVGHYGAVAWSGGYHGDVNVNVNNNYNRNANVNNSGNVSGGGNRPNQPPGQGNRPNQPPGQGNRPGQPGEGNRPGQGGNRPTQLPAQKWQPDQNRMSNSGASASTREARGWGSGGAQPSTGNVGARPSTGAVGTRPSTGNVGASPSTGAVGTRPSTGNANAGARPSTGSVSPAARPTTSPSASRPSSSASRPSGGSGGSAFGGVSSGASANSYSSRGSSSRSSGGYSGGGGGRGGGGGGRGGGGGGGRR